MDRILATLGQTVHNLQWKQEEDGFYLYIQIDDQTYRTPYAFRSVEIAREVGLRFLILMDPRWNFIHPKGGTLTFRDDPEQMTLNWPGTTKVFPRPPLSAPRSVTAEYESIYLFWLTFCQGDNLVPPP